MKNYPFIQHLEELRKRIIYSILFIAVASVLSYNFADKIIYHLAKPVGKLVFIQPAEAFLTYIKLAIFCGFFISSPFIIYQIWAFVSPGLRPIERKYVILYIPLSVFFFLSGAVFAFFVMIPLAVKFLIGYGTLWLQPMISAGGYVSFVCMVILVFGIVFELPVLILFLSKIRLVTPSMLRKNRKYVILAIFIIAAVFTPPDVFSQILMAVPLLILYELSIFISYAGKGK